MPLNTSINKKLIDAYFGTTELNNNFGYAFYGMFRLQRFRNLGLVPEIVFGDRFFLMKLLATGGRVEKTSKAFRVDRKTNKAKPNSQIILEQFEKISSKKKSHEVHVEAAFNLWNFFNHGQYLFGNPKIDMRLIRAAHNIFFCAKFNKLAVKINKAESHQDYRVKIKPYNTSRQTKL